MTFGLNVGHPAVDKREETSETIKKKKSLKHEAEESGVKIRCVAPDTGLG